MAGTAGRLYGFSRVVSGDVFASSDFGFHWARTAPQESVPQFFSGGFEVAHGDPSLLFAYGTPPYPPCCGAPCALAILSLSSDGGASWEPLVPPFDRGAGLYRSDPENPSVLYAVGGDTLPGLFDRNGFAP